MHDLEIYFLLIGVIILVSFLANKTKIALPILLMITGLFIGFCSNKALVSVSPEMVFLIFLPPLLFEAAFNVSWHEFKAFRKPIFFLAIGLVIFTALCVALTVHLLIPEFSLLTGLLLGAIVAPPDAVAATSVTKNLPVPKRVTTILEGESLVNDASSLILYQFALLAVTSGKLTWVNLPLNFIVMSGGGVLLGLCASFLFIYLLKKLNEATIATIISLLLPIIIYIIAEKLHISGVLAVVSCGLHLSWYASEVTSFQMRFKMKEFWEVLIFVLNGIIFILLGLQLPELTKQFDSQQLWHLIGNGLIISLVVIIARIVWVFPVSYINVSLHNRYNQEKIVLGSNFNKHLFVIAWSGMRGMVSLAIAMALPLTLLDGTILPMRNEIVLLAFVVISITLILHGLTLPLVIRKLKLAPENEELAELERKLRQQIFIDSLEYLDNELINHYPSAIIDEVKQKIVDELNYHVTDEPISKDYIAQRLRAVDDLIAFQRKLLRDLHRNYNYGSTDIIRKIETDIDVHSLLIHSKLGGNSGHNAH
jgi:CPA1 family monovalent cation:H+ antiporter